MNLNGVQAALSGGRREAEDVAVAKVIGQCAEGLVQLVLRYRVETGGAAVQDTRRARDRCIQRDSANPLSPDHHTSR